MLGVKKIPFSSYILNFFAYFLISITVPPTPLFADAFSGLKMEVIPVGGVNSEASIFELSMDGKTVFFKNSKSKPKKIKKVVFQHWKKTQESKLIEILSSKETNPGLVCEMVARINYKDEKHELCLSHQKENNELSKKFSKFYRESEFMLMFGK